ncbi:uncharacterized protein ACA1_333490 [Acanthamoeba castellanii str. Neff]|uniref:EF-hand domain-containing protein n=1 Tax=Acanthamoeba castellanii (strain ATCC 30010 / Neff) TaxID=1257118 RepID=L8HFZ4_ACACF|nr:uncharacterized protein ACA1_333490 [Acanthamoeba castellanii str. Neff]ELR24459.1 hypothetical protein ACA1_333490 [Acanthamoeba castellanii str. Neff]
MGSESSKLAKKTGFTKEEIKDLEKMFCDVMTHMHAGLRFKLTSASLTLQFHIDEDTTFLLGRLVTTLYLLSDDSTQEEKINCTPTEYQEASELLVHNISNLSVDEPTEVETFNITKDQQLVKLSPQDLQGQITHKFLLEADTDKDGKISTEEFNAFTLKHPMTLVGLIHMHTILLNLLQHCKWIQNQEKQGTSDYPACPST